MKSIFSMESASIMLALLAIACAVATFVETAFGTPVAWASVYNAWWFGLIMLLLGLNLAYNIYRYRLGDIKKLPTFIFHLSFLFILLGAGLTRYFGFEGNLHIREGEESSLISTKDEFVQLISIGEDKNFISADEKNYLSGVGKMKFDLNLDVNGKNANLKFKEFIPHGELKWVKDESQSAPARIEFLFSNDTQKQPLSLLSGQSIELGEVSISFNTMPKTKYFIYIKNDADKFYINSNFDINATKMGTSEKIALNKNEDNLIDDLSLYSFEGTNFAPVSLLSSAVEKFVPVEENLAGMGGIIADLSYNNESKEVLVIQGEKGLQYEVGGANFITLLGPKMVNLPFKLALRDFVMDRYPGTNSPSGYKSEVTVKDGANSYDYDIYMNHVLDHGGYRFFQSSYDRDEGGTVLSVNRDPGKFPTYLGYFLLCLGMFLNFLNPNSRFFKLSKLISENTHLAKSVAILAVIFACVAPNLAHAEGNESVNLNEIKLNLPNFDKEFSKELSKLVVQGFDGRMEPFDTVSREILHKIYRGETYKGEDGITLNHNEALLSFMLNQDYWRTAKIIRVGDKELRKILGLDENQKYASMMDFFEMKDNESFYKLDKLSEEINRKPLGNRSTLDKEIVKVNERVNVFYGAIMGEYFRIIPTGKSNDSTWISPFATLEMLGESERDKVRDMSAMFATAVIYAQNKNDWQSANKMLSIIKDYQIKNGGELAPSDTAIKYEILYNNAHIFKRLFSIYTIAGFLLLIFIFIRMMKPNLGLKWAFNLVWFVNVVAFLIHTFGLGLRAYVSGHAPWSNSYESMIYIAWALALSGIFFSRKSAISLALTAIMAGITLMVAHLTDMDPQITNLQPVLKSHWLTIHVSVITASYGFLGLCMLLGIFTLLMFCFGKNNPEIARNITEATRINEMSMILGLCLLTAGNFLGGVWANESWGRYWGWDPKETWALITIFVYAIVVHFRFMPKLNSQFAFAVASMFAYFSVIMTYFGVNFYLTGMHSYAAGEKIPVPSWAYIMTASMFILAIVAYFRSGKSARL